ncbi:AfsR/SARP family transcriptional regulator [Kineosporia babensis]|uniref:Bacterial transcriptional activator domain-containing protein n=1 Tax=Kineosporia babensis TaxID=499548 RepID=A0A9X1NMK1_9ACTN|nr:bacterial transcriptional activator domain-containing protein [Kineosporia babensis]MCD5316850.1 bacterial transcriptional activator domain-containing protein [Kineosporia babensis]
MRALRLYLRALGAAAILAAVLFGLPIVLWAAIGNPLPDWDALQVGDFSDDVLLHMLATLLWLAWASFVLTVTVEARAQSLERPAPTLPVLPGQQNITRSLITALVLAAPALAVSASGVHQAGTAPDTIDPAHPGTTTGQTLNLASTAEEAPRTAPISQHTPVPDSAPAHTPEGQPLEPAGSSSAQTYLLGTASGIGVSLAAAGLHAVVVRRRRHQNAGRHFGHLPEQPSPEAVRVERHLVTSASLAQALRERLHTALQHLAAALEAEGRHPVRFLAARLDAERTELVPQHTPSAPPPPPWDLDQASGHWILKDGAVLDAHIHRAVSSAPDDAPHRWAWIGSSTLTPEQQRSTAPDEGDVWLLNLTAARSIRIFGDPDHTADLTRAILLSQTPSSRPPASPEPAHRVQVHSDAHDLAELAHLVGTEPIPADVQLGPTDIDLLLVVDERGHHDTRLRTDDGSASGRSTIVLTDDLSAIHSDNVRLVIDTTGRLHLSFAEQPITAALLTRSDINWISPLLMAVRNTTQRPAPWAAGATATNDSPHAQSGTTSTGSLPSPYNLDPSPADDEPTGAQPRRPEEPATPPASHPDDATLDADLQDWYAENTARPRLRLLGPLDVRSTGTPRPGDRIPWQTEIVVLLYAHPQGLTHDQFTECMWPHDSGRKAASAMPRQAIGRVRHWLGTDPGTGEDYLPKLPTRDVDARYRIHHLLTDADLARRLYQRATSTPEPSIRDLQAALDLITGPVLDGRRPTGYLWLLDTLLETELTALAADIAHALASHWLSHGEPDRAMSSSKVAVEAGSGDDMTYLDLIAAADASGRTSQADYWLRQLLQVHDATTPRALPPQTAKRLAVLRPELRATRGRSR